MSSSQRSADAQSDYTKAHAPVWTTCTWVPWFWKLRLAPALQVNHQVHCVWLQLCSWYEILADSIKKAKVTACIWRALQRGLFTLKCSQSSFHHRGLFAVFYFGCNLFKSDVCVCAALSPPQKHFGYDAAVITPAAFSCHNIKCLGETGSAVTPNKPLTRHSNPCLTAAAGVPCNRAALTAGGSTTVGKRPLIPNNKRRRRGGRYVYM